VKDIDTVGGKHIAVDFDGTLATYDHWRGASHTGEPTPKMPERVRQWLAEGLDVRIMTARVCAGNTAREDSIIAIETWCLKHLGRVLPIISEKTCAMVELWDDRAKQVIPNTGESLEEINQALLQEKQELLKKNQELQKKLDRWLEFLKQPVLGPKGPIYAVAYYLDEITFKAVPVEQREEYLAALSQQMFHQLKDGLLKGSTNELGQRD